MGTSKPTDHINTLAAPPAAESREQLILRRRSAQRAWRTARESAERAAVHLRTTQVGHAEPGTDRHGLERARVAERLARASYRRVAEETGRLLDRLARGTG